MPSALVYIPLDSRYFRDLVEDGLNKGKVVSGSDIRRQTYGGRK